MVKNFVLNWAHELSEKPLYICVVGSRMCGYEESTSDWDCYVVCDNTDKKIKQIFQTDNIFYQGEEIGIRIQPIKEVIEGVRKGDARITEKLHSPVILYEKRGWRDNWQRELNKQKILENFLLRIKTGVDVYEDKLKALVYAYRQSWTAFHFMKHSEIILNYKVLDSLYPGYKIREVGEWKRYRNIQPKTPEDLQNVQELIKRRTKDIEMYLKSSL